jgi:hypothetical protein
MELTLAHWVYLAGIIAILGCMIFRLNLVIPCLIATLLTTWAFTGNFINGIGSMFTASLTAASALFNIFLIIAVMVALLNMLKRMQSDIRMVQPIRRVMVNGHVAFFVLCVVTWAISLFFWPTPTVPLMAAVLIPAAIVAGLPAMGAAMAVALAGQGMALSSDYILQVAPGITVSATDIDPAVVADRALVLSLVTGVIAIAAAYFLNIRKTILSPDPAYLERWERSTPDVVDEEEGTFPDQEVLAEPGRREPQLAEESASRVALADEPASRVATEPLSPGKDRYSRVFAALVPLTLLVVVGYMLLAKFSEPVPDLAGSAAAALVGGVAVVLLASAAIVWDRRQFLETVADQFVDGLLFAFKAMGAILPIAGFFFLGSGDYAGTIMTLGEETEGPALLDELVQAGQAFLPQNQFLMAFGILILGMITGLDGSGFSGLNITGSMAAALGPEVGMDPAALAAIGQVGGIWVGGGTLVIWSSLIAVAAFSRVSVVELARQNLIPVILGLAVSTIVAVLLY